MNEADQKHIAQQEGAVKVIGNFNLTAQLPNQRGINIAGYLYEGEAGQSINDRIDMLQEVIERQRARCEIPELEAAYEQHTEELKGVKFAIEQILERQKNGQRVSADQKTLGNMQAATNVISERLAKGAKAIAAARAKAGME